jgi:hypothetical protein
MVYPDKEKLLKFLQEQVDGFIEMISCHHGFFVCFINEEGKIHGLPMNEKATKFCHENTRISKDDYIAGTMVIIIDDGGGNTRGLSNAEIEILESMGWMAD